MANTVVINIKNILARGKYLMAALMLFMILLVPVFMIAQYFVNPSLVFTLMTWAFSDSHTVTPESRVVTPKSRVVTPEYPHFFDA